MTGTLKKKAMAAAVVGMFGAGAGTAGAAGFALIEQSGSGMGNAFAGAAATAEDASTIFFNPAGIARLKGKQVALAGHIISVNAEFTDNGSSTAPATIGTLGGNGGDAGDTAFVPNAYFSMPLDDRLFLGIGINAPFGLATEYDESWVGRFQGIKSELMTININPTVVYKVSETMAVGFGINYQQFDAELTNKVNGAGVPPGFPGAEFGAKLEADDDGFGWNVGVLFQATPDTRIGASYRSAIDYTLEGNVTLTSPAGAVVSDTPAQADVTLPDMFSISLVHALSDRFDLLADITFTRWSEIDRVVIVDGGGAAIDTLVLDFDDTFRYSIGVNYKCTDRFIGKVGLAYDESPVNDSNRTVRLPDTDRFWIALGGSYKISQSGKLDFGYAHLFTSDADINQTRGDPTAASFGRVAGTYESSIDILSVQYSMTF